MPKGKKMLVEKRNILNEMHAVGWTYQELRLFSVYLSRINARDISTRCVRFSFEDFRIIMGLDADSGTMRLPYLKNLTKGLLQKVVTLSHDSQIYYDSHGNEISPYSQFQLFKECEVERDKLGEWYITLDAHDRALPLMFDFKDKYFTYPVENILSLDSFNRIRMYEILAQHRYTGRLIVSVDELRQRLGLKDNEYKDFKNFRVRVLESCQAALEASTDLSFTFAPYSRGQGGKILELEFIITKNKNFVRQIFLPGWPEAAMSPPPDPLEQYDPSIRPLAEATNLEFSNEELLVLDSLIAHRGVPAEQRPAFLQLQLRQMNANDQRKSIKNRFKYLQTLISEAADKPARSSSPMPSAPSLEEIERLEHLLAKQSEIYGQTSIEGM